MVKYWQCGEHDWDIDGFVDQNVGEALQEYIVEDGTIMMSWWDEPEPSVCFVAGNGCEFEKEESLYRLIVEEIGMFRRVGENEDDLFFDPEGDRRCILMQELLRTYLKWKEGGVHQPKPEVSKS
jgi:hypothetical protein